MGWVLEDLVKCYENYVRKNPQLMNSLHELEGKQLGCWCKPGLCHGDVLVKLYKEKYEQQPSEKKRKTMFWYFLFMYLCSKLYLKILYSINYQLKECYYLI